MQRRGEARADAISPQAMHRDTSLPARSDGVWQQQPAAEIDGVSEHHRVIFCSETAVQELTRFLHRSRRDTRSSHARWYVAAAANSRNRRCLRAPHSGGARTFSRNPILSSFRTWRQHGEDERTPRVPRMKGPPVATGFFLCPTINETLKSFGKLAYPPHIIKLAKLL